MSQDEEATGASWARRVAERIVDGVLMTSERLPKEYQSTLLREIARRALWHMPNSGDEVRALVKYFDIENLRQPNPFDNEPPGG